MLLIQIRLVSFITVAFFTACFQPVWAHDRDRPDLNDWFNHLTSGKGACCSNSDGTVLEDADWDTRDNKYRVRIDGEWIVVPDDAVITEKNLDGKTMVWPLYGATGVSVRCFMPGSMT